MGIDEAAGTTYARSVFSDVAVGAPGSWGFNTGAGVALYFPYYIKAGSLIAFKLQNYRGVITTMGISLKLLCAPRHHEACPVGHKIIQYGGASGLGTTVTPGGASEGAWTQIGTVAAGHYPWWWQTILIPNDATSQATTYHMDLAIGDATNKHIVFENQVWGVTASESVYNPMPMYIGCSYQAVPGDIVYVRLRYDNEIVTPDTDPTVAVFGLW